MTHTAASPCPTDRPGDAVGRPHTDLAVSANRSAGSAHSGHIERFLRRLSPEYYAIERSWSAARRRRPNSGLETSQPF